MEKHFFLLYFPLGLAMKNMRVGIQRRGYCQPREAAWCLWDMMRPLDPMKKRTTRRTRKRRKQKVNIFSGLCRLVCAVPLCFDFWEVWCGTM